MLSSEKSHFHPNLSEFSLQTKLSRFYTSASSYQWPSSSFWRFCVALYRVLTLQVQWRSGLYQESLTQCSVVFKPYSFSSSIFCEANLGKSIIFRWEWQKWMMSDLSMFNQSAQKRFICVVLLTFVFFIFFTPKIECQFASPLPPPLLPDPFCLNLPLFLLLLCIVLRWPFAADWVLSIVS